ncbi:hypothetical protein E4U43_006789 [Claviceps pusilla]|uniref:Uncharacterized protein n=1 Tax=Claviceps pusilla TaxID=123648 RepID=A0A9P7N167_9HYPO|nr:hypothetical protein E4U43_006789 [Claviceps pusilla]
MYLHVAGPDPAMVEKAKELCDDLMINVKEQYDEFKARPPRFSDRGGYHGGDRYRGGHDRHHYDRGHHHHNHSSYSGYAAEPRAAPPTPNAAAQATDTTGHNLADYQAAYAQYYGGNDPYAAYGGFANYVAMYQQYYAQAGTGVPGQPAAPTSLLPQGSSINQGCMGTVSQSE